MRTFWDRVRHTLLFELIAVLAVAFGGSWLLSHPPELLGLFSIIMSLLAMSWNFIYNWLFDLWDLRNRGGAPRGPLIRVIHAVLFEAGMLLAGVFIIAWILKIGLLEALLLDIGFAVFFLIYAFLYNWAYDVIFPKPALA